MSSTPEQFLTFAIAAHAKAAGAEFDYRNAASRAYYAAFHCCYAERKQCPNLVDTEIHGSHDRLYARFNALPITPISTVLKSMAYLAKLMKTVRHKADYCLHDQFSFDDSAQQINDATVVHRKWKQIQSM